MTHRLVRFAVLFGVAVGGAAAAPPPATPMLAALRSGDWAAADGFASQTADPRLAAELVRFVRLLRPGQARADEIAVFLASHPAWPDRAVLIKRMGEAVMEDPDDAAVLPVCTSQHFAASPQARCAAAFDSAGRHAEAAEAARLAWEGGITDPAEENAFRARWSAVLTSATEWRRFGALVTTNDAAAAREVMRLDADHRQAALARLAWKHDDADALSRLALVPEALRGDPALVLENARSLRRTGALPAAVALWRAAGAAAETAVPAEARGPFWAERDALSRKLLLAGGSDRDAAFLADDALVAGDQAVDALFLGGWIALRRLHDTPGAVAQFTALADRSHSAITQGRAHYWLAQALKVQGHDKEAGEQLAIAARWPTSFYGQAAARALGDATAGQHGLADPVWTSPQALAFAGQAFARAAEMLGDWGDGLRAKDFLIRLAEVAPDDAARSWEAHVALRLGLPDVAVQIARLMGRAGAMLPDAGWPMPAVVPEALPAGERPLVLAIMRQESNFNASVVSHAGAQGLMQVMPATARTLAGGHDDLFDPAANVRIGSAYLQQLQTAFPGNSAAAIAAYNAGPNRVRAWLAGGDPEGSQAGDIDWIELIPFSETRNYVERVLEGETIYAAKVAAGGKPLSAP